MKQGRMKIYIKRTVACAVTIALITAALVYLTDLTERKDSDSKYAAFFEEEQDFDVLFFGTSHVLNAILPMELWEEYGITGYNMGGHGNAIATSYWMMELALDYTEPAVVVVDCMGIAGEYKTASGSYSYVHQSLDAFPLSATKVRAVLDLLDDEAMNQAIADGDIVEAEERTPISLLWNFSVYHSRWSELTEDDFHPAYNVSKGAEVRNFVAETDGVDAVSREEMYEEDSVAISYLERLIGDCQSRGIEVLLVNVPYRASAEAQRQANRIYVIAEEYGVDYVNFLAMDVVNYDTDIADTASHLNSSGARKVTDYLGAYIAERYGIEDKRDDEELSGWNEDYRDYMDYKNSCFQETEDLDVYLMLLADDDYDAVIEPGNCAAALGGSAYYGQFLENIGIDPAAVTEDITEIRVVAGGEQVLYTSKDQASALEDSAAGDTDSSYGTSEESYEEAEDDSAEAEDNSAEAEGSLCITVTEHESGDPVDVFAFELP